jgi:excinuclease ABC subunit A
MKLDRYKTHDIELVIDRLVVDDRKKNRLSESLKSALRMGKNTLLIEDIEASKVFTFSKKLMDPETGISYEEPSPNSFSFNSPYGACPTCKGLGTVNKVDMDKVIPDDSKSINQAGIAPFGDVRDNYTFKQLRAIARKYKFTFSAPINEIPEEALNIILHGGDEKFAAKFEKFKHDFVYNLAYEGLTNMLQRWYTETTSESIRSWAERFMSIKPCDTCHGARLRFESLQFKINDKTISDLAQMDLSELNEWFLHLDPHLSKRQKQIGNELIKEIRYRLGFLVQLGLGYLQADRPARTLSGGETQRTRLATQIGSQLSGITYILDEPSIGLHQRDNHRLIEALHGLTEIGNTVIVVEHDKDIMLSSDYLIDLGPGAGKNGGEVVATGSPDHVQETDSLTSAYLRKILNIDVPKKRRKSNGQAIVLSGASGNNLNDISVRFPLGLMICVTGVSGSGKSSLVSETLYPILRQHLYGSIQNPLPYEKIEGIDLIDKIIEIDQKPIGRTPRSNPATYTNVFTEIRKLYAKVPEAMIRGYKPGRFSFNVKGGRCEICKGSGKKLIEMNFLPNVYVDCDNCHGKRYNRETLEIIYKGKSISDVLNMSIDEGVEFFASIPKIYTKIKTIQEVGLGYITLGQQATTLSGGEAQRVKLAEELSKRATGKTLYILDEPTTGLHFQDIVHLLEVLGKLTKKGNTIIIIEHNMDVIKMADYIIDLGPGGGREGGNIVVSGTPEQVVKVKNGFTWQYLTEEL